MSKKIIIMLYFIDYDSVNVNINQYYPKPQCYAIKVIHRTLLCHYVLDTIESIRLNCITIIINHTIKTRRTMRLE